MEEVEVNVNGLRLEGVFEVDADNEKGCLILRFEDGSVQEVYLENKKMG